jgi:predicted phage terminase large subunit-like protein
MNINYEKIFSEISRKIKKDPNDFELWNALYILVRESQDNWSLSAKLKALISEKIKKTSIQGELEDLYRETLLFEARGLRFDSYMQYIELPRDANKKFWLPRRKQLLPVCNAIQKLIDDELDILTISLPPGTGKSTLEIFLHSMLIGANPDNPSLASGHSGILTNSIYEGVLSIINDSEEYLWHDIFPKAGDVITNAKEQTIDLGKKHRFSSLTCRAIGASLTGATRCEQILTADDLVSGIEEALSPLRLEKLWQLYNNDLKSRKKLGCKELHLATRWSVHDPIGRLQVMYEGDPRFMSIVVPALDENGESNFDYEYNVGFDKKYFEEMRESLDDASFRALFMNQPIEREGLLYDPDSLKRYFSLPNDEPDAVLAVCDTKDRGKDYCVLPIVYVYGQNYYIEDVICDNSLPEIVDNRLIEILNKHNVQQARFESNSAGGRIANDVQKALKEKGQRCHITTKYTTQTKETKIIVNSAWVKDHCYFKEDYVKNSDYGRFMSMLTGYTQIGKNEHDDAPDAMAMLAEFVQSLSLSKVETFKRPF